MKKMILKNCFRDIKTSFGRFFAIFAIVTIGVAFFAGVTATAPDMKNSSDCYYDEYNLMDIRLLSNIGFTNEDIEAIKKQDTVEGVFATYNMDAVAVNSGIQNTVKLMGLPDSGINENNVDYINRVRIKEGRLPENEGECVIVNNKSKEQSGLKVGDVITMGSGDSSDIADKLKNTEYTIVGVVYTPYYLSFDYGQSTVGSGRITYCIMLNNSEFISDYYTEVFATVRGVKELDTYSQEYFDKIGVTVDSLEKLASERVDLRIADVREEIADKKAETVQEAKDKIADSIREQIIKQYQIYYPGQDMSAITAPIIEEATKKAIDEFDTSEIDSKFAKAEEEALDGSDDWQWYILDRDSHYSYRDYKSSAEKIESIAAIFPVFFLLVAALVCLTTMTRMVDEQRELIGTLKALGYNKFDIVMKFVLYSFIASVVGGVLGSVTGLKMFPSIIYNCWNILYDMPDITYAGHIVLSVVSIGLMCLVIIGSTIYACSSDLTEVPAMLMRPKSPKKGKKILLERIGFIWKRMSFSNKVTARNIFRYKKRFFMTVVGVAGGGALMMAGFGIKDSITSLIANQFEEIVRYDVSLVYNEPDVENVVKEDSEFTDFISVYNYQSDVASVENVEDEDTKLKEDVIINVVSDTQKFKDFVLFRKRNTKTTYDFGASGVYISEKLAKDLGVKAGDTVYVKSGDDTNKPVKIEHIIEMYTGNYIFMSAKYYDEIYGEEYSDNCIYGMIDETASDNEAAIGEKYLAIDGVTAITFYSDNIKRFNDMIETLNLVTYILILSAAALSFVVLYNLTNVNMSERIREIATIKVLGFYNGEVAAYVYRENIVISIIGALAGLGFGVILHRFIMDTIEMESIMFGNAVTPWSFVYSFLLTILFSLIVNAVMYRKLKKIPMVESLKSVE